MLDNQGGIMPHNIFAQIRQEYDDFLNNDINIVSGYNFNQYNTIKKIHLYTNSKFESSPTFLGRKKVFYNIVNPPIEIAAQMLDLDVKNIRLKSLSPSSYIKTFLLEKELQVWLKKSKFGKILNQISMEVPTFGSVVLQKTRNSAKVIDLRRMIIDPTVENITDSRFISIVHYFTESELRKQPWDRKAIEIAISRYKTSRAPNSYEGEDNTLNEIHSSPYIRVVERYGEVPKSWITKRASDEDTFVKTLYIVAEPFDYKANDKGLAVEENGVVLFSSQWSKDYPFKDFHYTKTRGRWLGIGVVEKLFDMQMRINELKNQQRIAMELHSTPIYQTADRTIVNNVLSDLRPGDLLTVRDKISPIDTSNRSLQDFVQEERSVITQANSLTFSNDTARGNPLPASTPATNALIADTQTKSVFGFKRQNYDLFLQDYFNEMVLPQLIKDLTPEHIFRFVGSPEELIKLDEMISSRYSNRIFAQKILSSVDVTPEEALEASEQAKMSAIKKLKALGTDRWLKIKENMYNNADFEFDFIITNEQVDPAVIAQNANAALTAIAQNQIDLNNPLARSLFYKYAEAIGINPTELEANRQLVQASPMQSQITQTQPSPEGEQATQGIQGLTQPMA